jgi:two-component system chemotaxis sensor kinase CheA
MDDLISEFITETVESLSLLDNELVNLEQNPDDIAILSNIFRVMHTIKGTCGFLGLPRLEGVAHASENVLGKIRDRQLQATPQAISLVLESLDCIKGLIDHLSTHGSEPEGSDAQLKERLNHFAETGEVMGAATPPPAAKSDTAPESAANGSHDPFPFFKGEDDPEIAAAIEKLMAEQNQQTAPVSAAPADAVPAAIASVSASAQPSAETKPAAETKSAPATKASPAKSDDKENAGNDAANQSIRVNINVLENLMQMVSELVLTRNQLMQIARTKDDKEFLTPLQQLSLITTELQEGVMKTRMQPIGNAWSKFPRLIRDLSMELGKKIELKMIGADTDLDRQLLEVIKDPLTHMVRNSCDHGLETPDVRRAAGKPETGTVTLSAYHEGGHIIIEIADDGRGINIERVKQKALENGLATEAELAAMTEKQIAQYIFAAGFSTAEKVTSVSGRGVGMDVVRTNIQKIGGTIDLDSSWGKGSTVAIKIPLTLAIVSVLLVEAGGQKFGVPQINVVELVRVSPDSNLAMETINDSLVLRLRDKLLPLGTLSHMLGFNVKATDLMQREMYIVVCKVGAYEFGIVVDRVFDTEEIVVKPVAEILKSLSIYSGNTILGDGSVIMILDANGLAKAVGSSEMATRSSDQDASHKMLTVEGENLISFLLFTVGKGAPKAVPLELVSRLEEVDISTIEIADDYPVVQYRGELMRLKTLDDSFSIPNSGTVDVIVFSYDKKVVGLVVKEILDIMHAPFSIKLSSRDTKEHGYLGSMVIDGKTTDIVDVAHLLSDMIGEVISDTKKGANPTAQDCQLLLVEDSPFFRNLTVPLLSAAGYKVTAAEDAKHALDELSQKKYDMIVTDIEMPGMDGFDFAAACRSNPKINGTPIVAYTATVSDEVIKRSKTVGMQDCIVKTDRPGLLESVARCLSNYRKKEMAA